MLRHPDAGDLSFNDKNPSWQPLRDDLYCMGLQYWNDVKQVYDSLGSNPTYNYYNYNYPSQQRVYQTFGFWRTVAMILFLMFVVVFTYYLVFEPAMISYTFHQVVDFLRSI